MQALHDATKAEPATLPTPVEVAQLKETMMKHRHYGAGPTVC
jgi:hypothetical protein